MLTLINVIAHCFFFEFILLPLLYFASPSTNIVCYILYCRVLFTPARAQIRRKEWYFFVFMVILFFCKVPYLRSRAMQASVESLMGSVQHQCSTHRPAVYKVSLLWAVCSTSAPLTGLPSIK